MTGNRAQAVEVEIAKFRDAGGAGTGVGIRIP